jgi:hypothetical protein
MLRSICIAILLLVTSAVALAEDLGTGFTYQGDLQFNNTPANGTFDFQVELFDVSTGGKRIGSLINVGDVPAVEGIFTLELDFGALPFNGDQLWLRIGIREGTTTGSYTRLLPRQKITATPYALHSETVAVGAVGRSEVNSTQVQERVTGNCAVGSFIASVNQNGSVNCAVDMAGLSSVTGANIVNGSIGAVDLNSSQSFTLGGATINGSTIINGALNVTGQTNVGLVRVSASYSLSSTASCHSHGDLTCHYGIGTVQCPVGTKVMGGGTNGVVGRYGSVTSSYPDSPTSWSCGSSDDVGALRTCYAVCARLE